MNFHHFGYACLNIEKESLDFISFGYRVTSRFEDRGIGVKGMFLERPNYPRIELVENLPGCHPLKYTDHTESYLHHLAYAFEEAQNIDSLCEELDAFLVSPPTDSQFFKLKIAFVMLRNEQILELINVF